ncbi:MAG: hypothetical protein ACOYEQ_06365 [Bacillota bacterium]
MSKIYGYIFKNKVRLAKGVLKHNLMGFLGLFLIGGFILFQAIRIVTHLKPGNPIENNYVLYIMAGFAAAYFYRTFLMKSPVIVINAATLHHTFYTKYFAKIMSLQYLLLAVKSLAVSGIAAYIIAGRAINALFVTTGLLLFEYLLLGELLAWISYNTCNSKIVLSGMVCLNALLLFIGGDSVACVGEYAGGCIWDFMGGFAREFIPITLLAIELIAVLWHMKHRFQLDYSKYEADLLFIDEATAAQSQNNLAKMLQIAKEHSLRQKYKVMLHHFNLKKHNVLVYKNLIETTRQAKAIWITLLALLVFAYTITKTTWLSWGSTVEFPEVSRLIAVFCIATVYVNLKEIFTRQANTIMQKCLLGLYIPFGRSRILLGYLPFPLIVFGAVSLAIGLCFGSRMTGILALFAAASTMYAAELFLLIKESKLNKGVKMLLNALLFSSAYLLFI